MPARQYPRPDPCRSGGDGDATHDALSGDVRVVDAGEEDVAAAAARGTRRPCTRIPARGASGPPCRIMQEHRAAVLSVATRELDGPEHLDNGVAAVVVRVDALHAVEPAGFVGAMADQVQVAALRQKIIKKRYNHESGEIKKE